MWFGEIISLGCSKNGDRFWAKALLGCLKLSPAAFRLPLLLSVVVTYPFDDATSPILGIFGAHGGGKSTRSLFVKKLLDEDMSGFIKPDNEVLRKARHRGIVAFDNESSFGKDFADTLSALVTGTGDSKRQLYTDDTEYAFSVKRPVIVNGINMPSDRADLLSRFVALEVPPISKEERVSESRFWEEFEKERGKLLGAYFDLLSGVLACRKPLEWAPRLSDWGELASALYEHMGWGRDAFELDYEYVEGGQHDTALDSLSGAPILDYLYAEFDDGKDVLVKTSHDMWQEVKMRVDFDSRKWFPQSAESFGKEVNRLQQALAFKGFKVGRGHVGSGNSKRRAIKVTRIDARGSVWASSGSVQTDITDPADIAIDKPESARPEGTGSVGSVLSTSSFSNKEKI